MSSSHQQGGPWGNIKCVSCSRAVQDPVQLPACLHILCLTCEQNLEADHAHNIMCPRCGQENARPSVLRRISGVEQFYGNNYSHDNSPETYRCGISPQTHDVARWFCFDCGKDLCGACRLDHTPGHKILLRYCPGTLDRSIWEAYGNGSTTQEVNDVSQEEAVNNTTSSSSYSLTPSCPICVEQNCQHMQLLHKLTDVLQDSCTVCDVECHVDKELKYFCNFCWKLVCGDCSHEGEHKLHDCSSVSILLKKSLKIFDENLMMLSQALTQDKQDVQSTEERLRKHVKETEKELISRKLKLQEEAEAAFGKAIKDAENQGTSVLADYVDKLTKFGNFDSLLDTVRQVLESLQINRTQLNVPEVIQNFSRLKHAEELVKLLNQEYRSLEWPTERRFVLPEPEAQASLPPTLARVGMEPTQLKLAFSFKLRDRVYPRSIVLVDNYTCLLSFKSDSGCCIQKYHYNGRTAEPTDYYAHPDLAGDYFISRFQSGEIVASYRWCGRPRSGKPQLNSVKYCGMLPASGYPVEMDVIKEFEFPPLDITTTNDNNILLCINSEKKCSESYLMLMSMRGMILKHTVMRGPDMISPNYVAVSKTGEICVSDTDGNSIVLLDQDLKIKERMKYKLPISVRLQEATEEYLELYKFQPQGVCYDSYGRILVADAYNNCVVRLMRAPGSHKYTLEPLVMASDGMSGFFQPSLVAMGEDSRLWIVCKDEVFVFEYCP